MGARPILYVIASLLVGVSIPAISDQTFPQTPSSETIELMQAETADSISLKEKVAFMTPNGQEIIPSPGIYRVEQVGQSALRLVPFGGKEGFVIKAESRKHEEDIGDPVALMAVDDEYLFHVVLLLPQQTGLEAIGSSSRGRHRGAPQLLSTAQLHEVLTQKKSAIHAPKSPR